MKESPSLAPVMKRLEHFLPKKSKDERINNIRNLIYDWPAPFLSGKIIGDYKEFQSNHSNKEQLQDELIALMIRKNREKFPNNYDLEKESREIKAIHALLDGKHVHMGTGEGKTTVVFPIVNIVEALTSDKKSSVMVTTDESLLEELKNNTNYFLETVNQCLGNKKIKIDELSQQSEIQGLGSSLKQKMIIHSLTSDDQQYSQDIKKQIRESYWADRLAADQSEKDFKIQPNTIIFATDRDLIFKYQDNPQEFIEKTGNIYFDEADVPYNRRSPYVTVSKDQYYSPNELIDSTSEWMKRYIIRQQLTNEDFRPNSGSYGLLKNKSEQLKKIKLSVHFSKYSYESPRLDDPIVSAFQKGIDIISRKLHLNEEEKKKLANRLVNNNLIFTPVEEGAYYQEIGEELASLHKKKGLIYTMNDTNPQVRDSYIDQMLSDHQFSTREQINILAMEGMFDIVPLDPIAHQSTTFQTFVNHVKGKLRCASGTLMFPDPETHKITRSSFASFLKDATDRKIEIVTPPQIKNVPNPEIFDTEKETINRLADSITGDKPTLVVSYHLDNAAKIFEDLKIKFGEKNVEYVPSKPSGSKNLSAYEERVKKIYSDLAEGKLKAVVSSGAAGFGVNIVKKDGSFPDLHIVLHDLPANRSQLMQILGRRRAPGDNFSWFVSNEFIEPYISLYEEKTGALTNAMGNWDRDEIRKRLIEAKTDPKKAKKITLEILRKSEASEASDDQDLILFDELLNGYYKKIDQDVTEKVKNEDNDLVPFLISHIGSPDNLRWFVTDRVVLIDPSISRQDKKNFFTRLNSQLNEVNPKTGHSILSEFITTNWYENRIKVVKEYYDTVIKEGGTFYYHQPAPKNSYILFFRAQPDIKNPDMIWGFSTVLQKNKKNQIEQMHILSYIKDNQVYFLYDKTQNYFTISSPDKLENCLNQLNSKKSFNLFNSGYSFLTN